jgi:pyruvate,orthophosphate dikinase
VTGASTGPAWEKPGPGAWVHDGAHSTGPVTPIVQGVLPTAMADGFRSFTGRYGLPISHIEVAYVNGFPFGSVRIAGVPPSDRPPPPAAVLRVLTRVHPEMRRRNTQALLALDERRWRADLERWFDELRPARLTSVRALQAVDPCTLGDDDLAAHLEACTAELHDGLREHFALVGAAGIPVGLHVLEQAERGASAEAAIASLSGSAATSTGAPVTALTALAEELGRCGTRPTTLADIREASPRAAAALDDYLADYGERVVGALDVTGRRLVELPDVIVRTVVAAGARPLPPALSADTADPVLADARLAVASRDDHAGISCMWPLGLTRRALLATGARAHGAGRVDDPADVLDATLDEATDLLRGGRSRPHRATLARRRAERERLSAIGAPTVLGELHEPPDPAVFPPGMRRVARAMNAFLDTMETRPTRDPRDPRDGVGVGTTTWRGRAVVALEPEDAIARLRPGDVLVTTTTTPAFNSVLPVAGALVTAHGGSMSHAGIAARELGIPAVLGVADILERIPDGAQVLVDPEHATVRLAPAHIAFGPGVNTPSTPSAEVGAKAAGLIAMSAMGLPVPPGVVLPVAVRPTDDPGPTGDDPGFEAAVRAALTDLEERTGCRLGDPGRPLVVSVRSGSEMSMPGMLDTVLDVGTTADVAAGLARRTGDQDFADDTRRRFLVGYAATVGGLEDAARLATEVATPEELHRELAARGCTVPSDPVVQVIEAARAVHRSWDGARAVSFRGREGIDDALGTTVTIQQMVFGNLGARSCTGVAFSRDPSTGAPGVLGDVLVGAQGDDVVDGTRTSRPLDELALLSPDAHRELLAAMAQLERHHADMVDVEFTVEAGRLHLLQCRPGRRTPAAALRIAVDMADDDAFALTRREAVQRCRAVLDAPTPTLVPLGDHVVHDHLVVRGLPTSPGRGVGVLVVSVEDALRRHDAGDDVVLVRPHTSPADVAAMAIARGIVTASGGLMSHAAVVARSWSVPAVVGAETLTIEEHGISVGGRQVAVGELVTVDGTAGLLLRGAHVGEPTDRAARAEQTGSTGTTGPTELETLRRWAAEVDATEPAHDDGDPARRDESDPASGPTDLDVLRALVLRGRADVDGLAVATAGQPDAVRGCVERLASHGEVDRDDRSTVAPTTQGRSRVAADLAAAVQQHAGAFASLLDVLRAPDAALKAIVTEHQLRAAEGSEPTDGDGPELARRIEVEVHRQALDIVASGARLVVHLDVYRRRLDAALDRLRAGDERFLASPSVDSYHSIWFELHEELIGLAGTDRATEARAGRT